MYRKLCSKSTFYAPENRYFNVYTEGAVESHKILHKQKIVS